MINKLLKELGHDNIQVTDTPVFYWNENCVTKDETAPVKQVSTYRLNQKSFKKIVIFNINDEEARLAIL